MSFRRIPWNKNHKCRQPSRLIFISTESNSIRTGTENALESHYLHCGVASRYTKGTNGWAIRNSIKFATQPEFWGWLYNNINRSKPTWIFSHDIAFSFTLVGGWAEIDCGRLRIAESRQYAERHNKDGGANRYTWRGKLAVDGAPFILEASTDMGVVKFVDTLNYWNVPLSRLARYVGLERLESDPFGLDLDDMYRRCERDVDIIAAAITRLMTYWKEHDCGNWQPTIAGLAYSAYRHGKESCQIVAHGDEGHDEWDTSNAAQFGTVRTMSARDVSDVERRCYFGGRAECLFVGRIGSGCVTGNWGMPNLYRGYTPQISGTTSVFDVNSMYAYVMKEEKHPIELLDAIKYPQMSEARQLIEEFWCCADVEVETDEPIYPMRRGQYSIYPTGRFSTSLCGGELQDACTRGDIRGIANICIYYSGRPFTNYIGTWHKRRRDAIECGKEVEQKFCSQMMQSLYGKLAQMTPVWQTCGNEIPPIRWGTYIGQPEGNGVPCIMRAIGGVSQYQTAKRNCRHTFTAAAASVTSSARVYMRKLISQCPPSSIVYTDTDALFVLESGAKSLRDASLVHPVDLGMLKHKGTYDECVIHGPKDYTLDGVRTIAGLRADAVELSERLWKQLNFEGVKSIIQHEPDSRIISREVHFSPSYNLHGREIGYDGWTTPMRLE